MTVWVPILSHWYDSTWKKRYPGLPLSRRTPYHLTNEAVVGRGDDVMTMPHFPSQRLWFHISLAANGDLSFCAHIWTPMLPPSPSHVARHRFDQTGGHFVNNVPTTTPAKGRYCANHNPYLGWLSLCSPLSLLGIVIMELTVTPPTSLSKPPPLFNIVITGWTTTPTWNG